MSKRRIIRLLSEELIRGVGRIGQKDAVRWRFAKLHTYAKQHPISNVAGFCVHGRAGEAVMFGLVSEKRKPNVWIGRMLKLYSSLNFEKSMTVTYVFRESENIVEVVNW